MYRKYRKKLKQKILMPFVNFLNKNYNINLDEEMVSEDYLNSLNKVFWRDDSIICSIIALKRYSETPRTEITIETL